MQRPTSTNKSYKPILPRRKEWPVVKLSRNRKSFVDTVVRNSAGKLLELAPNINALVDELEATLYKEKYRIRENPWAVDPEDDHSFWSSVKKRLVEISGLQTDNLNQEAHQKAQKLLEEITARYANEIASNFRPSYYRFARRMVTFGFSRLLNASRVKGFGSLFSNEYSLRDKIKITGEIEQLRNLAQRGTIVMVPTHFSNLDSILIGWVIHELGLPPFIYGAGLNLFNIGIFAYFMNSLGAYKVDRRKKNTIYIETLKAYSSLAMQWGIHSLFFPGGTRSRSGRIEDKLKLGLLGTAMEAQRINYMHSEKSGEPAEKIFVFPVVLNYHFVLEAPSLIRDYLQQEGQERYYIETDEYSKSSQILKFLLKFFRQGSDISVSIGKGMDLLGNYVDEEGHSLDKQGRYISMREYFCTGSNLTRDEQRENEYTRMLGEAILHEYYRINRVFSSHLVAFVAFELIKKQYAYLDFFSLLRLSEEDLILPYSLFRESCEQVLQEIFRLHKQGKVDIAEHLQHDIDEVITHGITNVGMYHARRPLLRNKAGDIVIPDLNILYYYHNRLEGYDLQQILHPKKKKLIEIAE
ncbi:MAG: 1-acyl-sn-glycerol-3-phosphate acyltransferase [Cyclobacteriaceae bacterium]